jgi:GNAT superfamily N-acetyltransferase
MEEVYYSDDYQIVELWNYVRPDCRKSDFAKRLIEFAKKCSTDTGMDLTIGIISNARMEAKCRLYGRMLPKAGEFYVWRAVEGIAYGHA